MARTETPKFTSSEDIIRSLHVGNESSLIQGARYALTAFKHLHLKAVYLALTTLRNQLTVKNNEPCISAHDERLSLVKAWMEASPGARDLFDIWREINAVRGPSVDPFYE